MIYGIRQTPSAQCTEAASKARRLIMIVRRSFQGLLKSVLYGALVRPRLKYGMSACLPNFEADINYLERIQRLATRLVTGIRQHSYEERLQRRGLRVDLILAFKIFTGLLDAD